MEIQKLIRKNILNLQPYTSARDIFDKDDRKIFLDANENSFGSTFSGINGLKLNRYPDPHQKELKKIVGKYYSIPEENLFFGVGSDEIIDLIIRIFCNANDFVLIPEPTYGMFKVACSINNIETKSILLNDEFQIDLSEAKQYQPKIIFLCSPNNPVGNLLNKNDVLDLCKSSGAVIVVDEAYIDFCIDKTFAGEIKNYPNLIILRTFSKAWGLAGIRLGYCIANEEIIKLLFKIKAPYNINSLTRYAVKCALENSHLKDKYVKSILKERERLKNQLESLKGIIKVYDSFANFLLFKCENAKDVQKKLADFGIIIRDRSSQPKLENCLRVTIGSEEENDKFWESIKKTLS